MSKLFSFCLLLLAWSTTGLAQGADPFDSARKAQLATTRLWTSAPEWISDGDFVHPAFSPDGSQLAYSAVLVDDSTESTDVRLRDIRSRTTRSLLSQAAAARFATYKVFVTDLTWAVPSRVTIGLSDGDVDYTELVIDPGNGNVLSDTTFGPGEELTDEGLQPEMVSLLDTLSTAFPAIPRQVLASALAQGVVRGPGAEVILQKNYADEDSDIWLLDYPTRQARVVLPSTTLYALGGGITVGDATLFLVSREDGSYLFVIRGATVTPLAYFARSRWRARLDVVWSSPRVAVVRLVRHEPYQEGDNPILTYSVKEGLRRVTDIPGAMYDAAIPRSGTRVAIVAWIDGKRQIGIADSRLP